MKGRPCPQCKKEIPFNTLIRGGYKKKPIKCPGCSSEFVWDMKIWYLWNLLILPAPIYIGWYLFSLFSKKITEHYMLNFLVLVVGGLAYLSAVLRTKNTKLIKIN